MKRVLMQLIGGSIIALSIITVFEIKNLVVCFFIGFVTSVLVGVAIHVLDL